MLQRLRGRLLYVVAAVGATAMSATQVASATPASADRASADTILIAGVVGASGAYGEIGVNMINAGKLAADAINAKGGLLGKKVVWKYADDGGNPTKGAQLFQKFVSDGAIAIVGSGDTGPATAAMSTKLSVLDIGIVDGGGPVIYPKGPGTTPLKWAFGYSTSTYELGTQIAAYAIKHCKSTALLHDQTSYGEGANQAISFAFKKANKKLVANDTITEDWSNAATVDISPEVQKIKDTGADCVIPWLNPENTARFVQTARSLSAKFAIIANDAAYGDVTYPKLAGADADGTISAGLKAVLKPNKALLAYQAAYKKRFKATADIYGEQSYDAIMMLAKAIRDTKSTDKNKLRDAFEKMSNYPGITGTLGFSKTKHESLQPSALVYIKYSVASKKWVPFEA
jgi:branched-chain amino acid transport system substrate-binding protein